MSNAANSPKLRLAIVGAGIGGLTLAVAINRLDHSQDIEVHLFEAASKLGEIGVGLTIFQRTLDLLRLLGCNKLIKERGFSAQAKSRATSNDLAFEFRKSDHKDGFTFLSLTIPGGSWTLRRTDLHQALMSGLSDNSHMHLSSRVIECKEQANSVMITLQDGTTHNFDLVVGADGIKSVIRQDFITANFPNEIDCIKPIKSGSEGYRALVPSEFIEKKFPNHRALTRSSVYCGKNKHVVMYPIANGSFINMAAFFSQLEEEGKALEGDAIRKVELQEVLDCFEGWEDEVLEVLKLMEEPSCWTFLTSKPISSYGSGRIALLGDAAHAMTPHLGSGAGQAMEDAYILASILTAGVQERIDVARMTEVYTTIRQPMGNFVLNNGRKQGLRYELNVPIVEDIQENEPVQVDRLDGLAEEITRGFKWLWSTSLLDDQRRALSLI